MAVLRGLDSKNEQDPTMLLRDTRTIGQRIGDFFADATKAAMALTMAAVCAAFLPGLADIILFVVACLLLFIFTRRTSLPFRMPQFCGLLDYNDYKPGGKKVPNRARGIYFFGNEINTNEELWFSNEDMRTHVLIFGSTGSGKTETLLSLAFNALNQASGFIYVDGKGDNSLFAKVYSMARRMGREDDILLINFMTGARDIVGPQNNRLSNTLNPFSHGSSSMLSQLVVSLMGDSSSSGDGDMWKGRAIAFVEALMKLLVQMRDDGHILLDANTIRNYFHLDRVMAMVIDNKFIRDNQSPVDLSSVPEISMQPIQNYMATLPGFDKSKKYKQVSQVFEQHGFITMQLTRVFVSLADTYGHIMRHNLAEVDFKDVVLNRRILVVLLPALEKAPDELANLGKVIIASLKAMMAAGLGESVEGSYREVIERKPTNAPTPYLCILDEYGYYSVEGFAVVPAQARSLGFSTVFAGQDLPAFQKSSKEEAASIGANTNIKIAMKLEDPVETWEFFQKTAGEAYVTQVGGFQTQPESVTNNYLDTRSASVEKRGRVDLLDLKDQTVGEMHIFFQSKIVRARSFFANPKIAPHMRLCQFLKVEEPPERNLIGLENRLERFEEKANTGKYFDKEAELSEDLAFIVQKMGEERTRGPIERGVQALLAYHGDQGERPTLDVHTLPETQMDVFMPIRYTPGHDLLTEYREWFVSPLVTRGYTFENMTTIERLSGRSKEHATKISEELIKDMERATFYPPQDVVAQPPSEIAALINDLVPHIAKVIADAKKEDDDAKK